MTEDELTDLTAAWLYAQKDTEPQKGGWVVNDCWVDRESYRIHAAICIDCRTHAEEEAS